MSTLRALLWDVDGTLAETERDGHRVAFNRAFESFGLPWRWDDAHYGELLHVSGGRERLLHDMSLRSDVPAADRERLARTLHAKKNALYAELMAEPGIALRPGVRELLDECRANDVRMAIATTTSRANLDALLARHLGPRWRAGFGAVICGEDVQRKKPDPEVFVAALRQLGVRALDAVAIEDSPGGVAAAHAADCAVVATRSVYFAQATIEGAIAVGPGLHQRAGWRPALEGGAGPVRLADVAEWFAQRDTVCDVP